MPKKKTELQKSLGKLISSIQKEWGEDLGEEHAEFSENVMDAAHDLLQAGTSEGIQKVLDGLTVRQYLGDVWVQAHPNVKEYIARVEDHLT